MIKKNSQPKKKKGPTKNYHGHHGHHGHKTSELVGFNLFLLLVYYSDTLSQGWDQKQMYPY